MKNHLLLFSFCVLASFAKAQSMEDMLPKTAIYYIKNGPQIQYDKIDSVITSWGGKFGMEHNGNTIYLSKSTSDDLKAIADIKAKSNLLVGQQAPDFSLTDISGKSYKLTDLKGKVVVLNFWFTTCSGCIAEMPELNRISKSFQGKNVVFIALGRDDETAIKDFLTRHEFNYTLLTNAIKTAADYKVAVYPTSMVIDQNGVIRFVQVTGEQIYSTLSEVINPLF